MKKFSYKGMPLFPDEISISVGQQRFRFVTGVAVLVPEPLAGWLAVDDNFEVVTDRPGGKTAPVETAPTEADPADEGDK